MSPNENKRVVSETEDNEFLDQLRAINGDPGPWMQTFTGAPFHPLRPERLDVRILDIAHGLGNECRFGGHSKYFYSVAQHSVLVSQNVSKELALTGLLHDATEAYLKDIPRPLKLVLAPLYKPLERALARRLGEHFGVELVDMPEEIDEADRRVLSLERRDVMSPAEVGYAWDVRGLLEPAPGEISHVMSPEYAVPFFIRRFYELTGNKK